MARIFISYRRSDSGGHSGLLAQHLDHHFPGDVFRDTDVIQDGDRWDGVICAHLQQCKVLLAVIGPDWLSARDPDSGQRSIDIAEDWVRREIETALANGVPVVPVLVGEAVRLRDKHRLPASLEPLTRLEPRVVSPREPRDDARRLAEHLKRWIGADASTTQAADPALYLRWLESKTARIDIRGLATGRSAAHTFPIEELYTPLTTVLPMTPGSKSDEPVELGVVVDRFPRLVLVGDPGAGKSTFLRSIAHRAAKELTEAGPQDDDAARARAPFPLLISAAALSAWIDAGVAAGEHPVSRESPEFFIRYFESAALEQGWNLPAAYFRSLFNEGCLLLVDGLDEAPDRRRRKRLARLIEEMAVAYPRVRIVATTRPSAYGGQTALAGFQSAEILPLDERAILQFVVNWSRLVRPDDPQDYSAGLLGAIRSRAEIEQMAGNPVMLTALAVLHWNERRLPDRRTELYDSILKWLVRAREDTPRRLSAEQCFELLRALAFAMQTEPRGRVVELSAHAAALALQPHFPEPTEEGRYEAAVQFLAEEETSTGILIARNEGLRFWHLSFQEYLAAHLLAVRSSERKRLVFDEGRLYWSDWRETLLLLAGILRSLDKQLVDEFLASMLDSLGPGAAVSQQAQCAGLIGSILNDLASSGYQFGDPRWDSLIANLEDVFTAEPSRRIDRETRLDAGRSLALVDPERVIRLVQEAQQQPMVQSGEFEWTKAFVRDKGFAGDYADILQVGPRAYLIVVADISGKGVEAALMAADVQAYFEALTLESASNPNAVLAALNDLLLRTHGGRRFVTAFCALYDAATGHVWFANAGHPLPICVRATREVELLQARGIVLGVVTSAEIESRGWPRDSASIQLRPGDLLAIFSDGVTEVMNDAHVDFGEARLAESILSTIDRPLDDQAREVFERVRQFSAGPLYDDCTLLLLKAGRSGTV